MATATIQVSFTITADLQADADRIRDNAVIDYCKAYNLDIYAVGGDGNPTSTIDQAKAAAAFRQHLRQHFRSVVKGFRSNDAARTAQNAKETETDQLLA